MTPERAGKLCDDLGQCLRGSEMNLSGLANTIVVVLREEAWRSRVIRTGELVECASFLEFLTAPPLKGYGEDPKRVEALLRDDEEALTMFRRATTAPKHKHQPSLDSDSVTITPRRGNSRAYTLDRLHREAPALYADVVAGTLSANQAAIRAGFRKTKTPLDQLRHWWRKASAREREVFVHDFQSAIASLVDPVVVDGGKICTVTVTAPAVAAVCTNISRPPDEEPCAWDALNDSEIDLLVHLDDLRAEITTREDQIRVGLELLAGVRDRISRRNDAGLR